MERILQYTIRTVLHAIPGATLADVERLQKAPVALKRQYQGLFWERFLVEDREIVRAVPTPLIRELQGQGSVILEHLRRASAAAVRDCVPRTADQPRHFAWLGVGGGAAARGNCCR